MSTIRVYATVDNKPLIIDVPAGELTCAYVAQARAARATNIRIHELNAAGRTVDKVIVR